MVQHAFGTSPPWHGLLCGPQSVQDHPRPGVVFSMGHDPSEIPSLSWSTSLQECISSHTPNSMPLHVPSAFLTHVSLHISSGVSFCMSSCSLMCLLVAPHTPHCCCPFLNMFEQQWHRLPCLLQHWGPVGCFHWLPSWSRAAHGLPPQPPATQTLPDMPNTYSQCKTPDTSTYIRFHFNFFFFF